MEVSALLVICRLPLHRIILAFIVYFLCHAFNMMIAWFFVAYVWEINRYLGLVVAKPTAGFSIVNNYGILIFFKA
jgi:hypothetical protein